MLGGFLSDDKTTLLNKEKLVTKLCNKVALLLKILSAYQPFC